LEKQINTSIWLALWCYLSKHINFLVGTFAVLGTGAIPKSGASTLWQLPANIIIFFCTALYYGSLEYNENQDTRLHKIQNYITESIIICIGLINKK